MPLKCLNSTRLLSQLSDVCWLNCQSKYFIAFESWVLKANDVAWWHTRFICRMNIVFILKKPSTSCSARGNHVDQIYQGTNSVLRSVNSFRVNEFQSFELNGLNCTLKHIKAVVQLSCMTAITDAPETRRFTGTSTIVRYKYRLISQTMTHRHTSIRTQL